MMGFIQEVILRNAGLYGITLIVEYDVLGVSVYEGFYAGIHIW